MVNAVYPFCVARFLQVHQKQLYQKIADWPFARISRLYKLSRVAGCAAHCSALSRFELDARSRCALPRSKSRDGGRPVRLSHACGTGGLREVRDTWRSLCALSELSAGKLRALAGLPFVT